MSYVTCSYSEDGDRCYREATTTGLDSMYYCAEHAERCDREIARRRANRETEPVDYTSENFA